MKQKPDILKKQFKKAWERYNDTLWKIEQTWNDPKLSITTRTELTETVVEMIKIERKLKSLENKYQAK